VASPAPIDSNGDSSLLSRPRLALVTSCWRRRGGAGGVPLKQLLTHRASKNGAQDHPHDVTSATESPATSGALAHDLNMLVSAVRA